MLRSSYLLEPPVKGRQRQEEEPMTRHVPEYDLFLCQPCQAKALLFMIYCQFLSHARLAPVPIPAQHREEGCK